MLLELQKFKFFLWLKPCFLCVKGTMINVEKESDFAGHHQRLLFFFVLIINISEKIIKYIKYLKRIRWEIGTHEGEINIKQLKGLYSASLRMRRGHSKTVCRFLCFRLYPPPFFKAKDKMLSCYKFVYLNQILLKEKDTALK